MNKTRIVKLDRDRFNEQVNKLTASTLNLKALRGLFEFSYTDKRGTFVTLICKDDSPNNARAK